MAKRFKKPPIKKIHNAKMIRERVNFYCECKQIKKIISPFPLSPFFYYLQKAKSK